MKRSALSAGLLVTVAVALSPPSAFAGNFNHPTYSSPIVISADNKLLWSVNPADDSVSVIRTDTNASSQKISLIVAKQFCTAGTRSHHKWRQGRSSCAVS